MNGKNSVSRRDFLKISAAAGFSINLIRCRKNIRKPNLLFIWTDEQRADTMQIYGNSKIKAPNLNKLASESIVFKNAYVTQPVCTPSRSTVMTGLWPHQNGCVENNIPLPENIPCFPEILNDPDYRTAYMGKWHLGDEIFVQHGFQEWVSIEDGYTRHYRKGRDKSTRSSYHQFLLEKGYQPDSERSIFSRGFAAKLPLEHCKPKFLELKAIDFLKQHQKDPFILYINFLEPHMPFHGPLNDVHQPMEVDLPPNFNDPLEENEPLRYRILREKYVSDGFEGHDLKTEAGWRRLIANYWGLVTQVDLSVGAILKALDDFGLRDNTIVVYTSDHGDMMGAHHLLAKTVMYEESVKIPWLMRIPGMSLKPTHIEQPVSHIDLIPTLLELMHYQGEKQFPGKSLMPIVRGEKSEPDPVFIEWNPSLKNEQGTYPMRFEKTELIKKALASSIRTIISPDGWKLCLSDLDRNQLFNLREDPNETTNLFDSDRYPEIINRLSEAIHHWQERAGDSLKV